MDGKGVRCDSSSKTPVTGKPLTLYSITEILPLTRSSSPKLITFRKPGNRSLWTTWPPQEGACPGKGPLDPFPPSHLDAHHLGSKLLVDRPAHSYALHLTSRGSYRVGKTMYSFFHRDLIVAVSDGYLVVYMSCLPLHK